MMRRIGQAKAGLAADYAAQLARSVGKVVFFAKHIDVMDVAEETFAKRGIRYSSIRGDQTAEGAAEEHRRLRQRPRRRRSSVCSLTAAGVGLNLQVASNMVLAELSWTDAEQTQAIDRIHRIGQDEPVTAWRIIAAQTIDTRIAELIDSKAGLAARALDGSDEEVVLLGRRAARGAGRAAHRGAGRPGAVAVRRAAQPTGPVPPPSDRCGRGSSPGGRATPSRGRSRRDGVVRARRGSPAAARTARAIPLGVRGDRGDRLEAGLGQAEQRLAGGERGANRLGTVCPVGPPSGFGSRARTRAGMSGDAKHEEHERADTGAAGELAQAHEGEAEPRGADEEPEQGVPADGDRGVLRCVHDQPVRAGSGTAGDHRQHQHRDRPEQPHAAGHPEQVDGGRHGRPDDAVGDGAGRGASRHLNCSPVYADGSGVTSPGRAHTESGLGSSDELPFPVRCHPVRRPLAPSRRG